MFTGGTHIFCPEVTPLEGSQFKISPAMNRGRLRHSILYFDEVIYVPYAAALPFAQFNLVDPEANLVVEQGVIKRLEDRRSHIQSFDHDYFRKDAEDLLITLNERHPDRRFLSSIKVSESIEINAANAIYCRIQDLLPVPSIDTAIGDIIAFKEENRKKLKLLGDHIEYLGVIAENNLQNIDKLIYELRDHLERLADSLKAEGLYGGRADFSITRIVNSGISSLISDGMATFFGLGPLASSMIGSSVEYSFARGPTIRADNSFPRTFEFLIDAGKQRIFSGAPQSLEPDDWLISDANFHDNTVTLQMPPSELGIQLLPPGVTISGNRF